MGDTTNISWTDSTMNWWEGCTKVGPGCDHCYAEARDIRWHAGSHWATGAPRRRMAQHTRNKPLRWQRQAAEFMAAAGHHQRVFASSLSDFFDNEIDPAWRAEALATINATPDLRYQICTKRITNVHKMMRGSTWPRNAGLLITTVTQEEVDRDLSRLRVLKETYGIPWVGLSVEPMLEAIMLPPDVADWLDWIIIGGESGPHSRRFELGWAFLLLQAAESLGIAAFVKQMGSAPTHIGLPIEFAGKGDDPMEWPDALRVQQFPAALA